MNIFEFITQELQLLNKSKTELNKRSNFELRYSYVYRAFASLLEVQPKIKKETAIKLVRRETGIKFENKIGRQYYERLKDIQPKSKYATRVSMDSLPDNDKIPLINFHIKDAYLYGIKIFIKSSHVSRKTKLRTLPRSAVQLHTNKDKYNSVSDFVFYSEIKLTKRKALAEFLNYLEYGDFENSELTGSDYKNFMSEGISSIIGYKYDRLVRT
jgi:hypothetical protein